jgi:hypothetical protein
MVIKFWEMRWVGHVASMEEMRNAYIIFVGKHESGILRRTLEHNIRTILRKQVGNVLIGNMWLRI